MVTPATLAEELNLLARTGTLDTLSPKQVLERIKNTVSVYYARSATTAISTLEEMVRSFSEKYGDERAKIMLIKSLQTGINS